MATALRDLIKDPTAAELELVARYAMLPEDGRRERAFSAFAATGLPGRRMEQWKWTDFKTALNVLESPKGAPAADVLPSEATLTFRFTPKGLEYPKTLPKGLLMMARAEASAFAASEDLPLGAMTAALSGHKKSPGTLMFDVTEPIAERVHIVFEGAGEANFGRCEFLLRPGASIHVTESYLGGAGLTSALMEYDLQAGAELNRTMYQIGGTDEAVNVTSVVSLAFEAAYTQSMLAFGAQISRLETRLTHQEPKAKATINAAYLAGAGRHVDVTTHERHGAPSCVTKQVTKGAVRAGGKGIFQGKFMVPRTAGQYTDADMQHHALLLEEGAEVFAKPELEIYADDVECAHGNTCGDLDDNALFYMRQRGLPEAEARNLLTQAFLAEALDAAPEDAREALLEQLQAWLAA
jgi:Fe-S cluster assembly protein SufD